MSLADCLKKITLPLDERREITGDVRTADGDEIAGVEAYMDKLLSDLEDARGQLVEQGYDVGAVEASVQERTDQEPVKKPEISKPKDGSWIAIRRESGEVVGEFQTEKAAEKLDPATVAVIPAKNYLARLNRRVRNGGATDAEFFKAMAQDYPAGPARTSDLDPRKGHDAYRNMSMDPEGRTRRDIEGYVQAVNGLYEEMGKLAKTEQQRAVLDSAIQEYRKRYIAHMNAMWGASSRTASPMVTGGSNFPVARNQKRLNTYDRRVKEFLEWEGRAKARIKQEISDARPDEVKAEDAWKKVEAQVLSIAADSKAAQDGEFLYDLSLFKNNFYNRMLTLARGGNVSLVDRMLDRLKTVHEDFGAVKPVFTDRHKVWKLGDIARANSQRSVANLEADDAVIATYDGATITNSPADERVRIEFDERVSREVATDLKKEGWRWSPKNTAWQRKNTPNAERSAKRIVGRHFTETTKERRGPVKEQRPITHFFSPLYRGIEGAKQKRAPAKDWKAIIRKLPGVKAVEIDWMGVDEWLDLQGGQVTKEDLMTFVRDSQIELVESTLAGDEPSFDLTVERDHNNPIEPDWNYEREAYLDEAREQLEAEYFEEYGEEPDTDIPDDEVADRAEDLARERFEPTQYAADVYDRNGGEYYETGTYDTEEQTYTFPDLGVFQGSEQDVVEAAEENRIKTDGEADGPSQFEQYTEEGGENYREILLHVPMLDRLGPNKPDADMRAKIEEAREKVRGFEAKMRSNPRQPGVSPYGTLSPADRQAYSEASMLVRDLEREIGENVKRPFVQRAHFDQENIVVHARVNDRTGANGEKILFVEEIQSDLASKWREGTESPEVTARRRELQGLLEDFTTHSALQRQTEDVVQGVLDLPEFSSERFTNDALKEFAANALLGEMPRDTIERYSITDPLLVSFFKKLSETDYHEIRDQFSIESERRTNAERELLALGTEKTIDPHLPDTPFKEEATYQLMTKHLLRMAAEGGYDQLAWTPGYMQAERWDAAAQSVVEAVTWRPGTTVQRVVEIDMADAGRRIHLQVNQDGVIDMVDGGPSDQLVGKQLSALIGPKLANRVMEERDGSVSGQKITFPDSGYAIAYDQQTRKAVDKFARKYGGKVTVDKSMPDMGADVRAETVEDQRAKAAEMTQSDLVDLGIEAGALSEDNGAAWRASPKRLAPALMKWQLEKMFPRQSQVLQEGNPVWSIDITPQLREAAMQPMPILQQGKAQQVDHAKIKAMMPALRKQLDKMQLKQVKLTQTTPDQTFQGVFGSDYQGNMTIVIGAALDPENTLRHEAIHALKAMDLFTPKEWSALTKEAERIWMGKYEIGRRYGEFPREAQIEEAIAEAFGDYQGRAPNNLIQSAFAKIKRFFRALREALAGQGITSIEDIFADVAEGRVGARDAGGDVAAMSAEQAAWHGSPHDFDAFSTEHMGKGEGAQAYGWGMYFADRKGVAEFYRDKLQPPPGVEAGDYVTRLQYKSALLERVRAKHPEFAKMDDPGRKVDNLSRSLWNHVENQGAEPRVTVKNWLDEQERFSRGLMEPPYNNKGDDLAIIQEMRDMPAPEWKDKKGRLYKVEVPENSDLLAWDAPLSEQPEGVREKLVANMPKAVKSRYNGAVDSYGEKRIRGAEIYDYVLSENVGHLASTFTPNGYEWRKDVSSSRSYVMHQLVDGDGVVVGEASVKGDALKNAGWTRHRIVSEWLKSIGIPGHRFLDGSSRSEGEGSYNYVIYDDAAVNVIHKEQRHPRASYMPQRHIHANLQAANQSRFARLKSGVADAVEVARINLQDRYLPILRAVENVEKQIGRKVPDWMNPYRTEEQMPGKVGRDLDDVEEMFVQPIIGILSETKGDLTAENVGDWLMARHAKERNARISQINPAYQPGEGSGLTDAEAQDILDKFARGPYQDKLDRIGQIVDELREFTLEVKVDAGLLTHADADSLRAMYQFYVPLRGFAETDNADAVLDVTGIGRRLNVRGPESKRALGRRSLAFNPLVGAITQAQEAAIRAGKNRVGNAFYYMVKANPSSAWDITQVKQKRYYNKATGMVETRAMSPENTQLEPDEFATKVGGQEYRIKIHDERLARAIGNIGSQRFGMLTHGLMMFSRYFSATNTMLNPEFLITNAMRDFTTAQVNIQGFGEAEKAKLAKAMAKNWRKAFTGAWRGMGDTADPHPWAVHFREFEEAGGKVSFWQIDDPNKASLDLEKRIKRASSLTGKARSALLFNTRDNPILRQIERANLAVDNAIRLAAFVEARNSGWSAQQAASLAKNLTVNFNRRGEATPLMNGLYPFFNAAVQGTHILLTALKYKRPRRIVLALVAMGVLEDQLNSWLSEDDDDGELAWDKVPDWKLRRSILINADGNDPWSIPLPYGYNVFPYMGKQASKVVRGVKKPGDALADILATAIESVSPISGSDAIEALTPTIIKPAAEIALNRDLFLGRPISPKKWANDEGLPDAYNAYRSTPEFWKEIADIMNRATGGSTVEPGLVDVSPDTLEHLFGFFTGGAGRFADRMIDLGTKMALGDIEGIELNDIPFARQLKVNTGDWLDRSRYFDFNRDVSAALNREKVAADTGTAMSEEDRALTKLKPIQKVTEKRLRKLRKIKYTIYDSNMPMAERNAKLDDIREKELELYLEFNRQYLAVMGPQGE